MPERDEDLTLSPTAELFAEYVARREAGGADDFERVCADHPELAADLRAMRAQLSVLSAGEDAVQEASAIDERIARLRADDTERLEERRVVERGGRGTVLEVWDRDLQRPLAKKVLAAADDGGSGSGMRTARALSRLHEEAQVTGQLDHPGIVPVHEIGVDGAGRLYFTMPLIRGESFRAVVPRVRSGEWSLARAIGLVVRVTEALAYAHSRGVVHRDVKPQNVMVGAFGEAYVIDWGLARVEGDERGMLDEGAVDGSTASAVGAPVRSSRRGQDSDSALLTGAGDVVGTPAYMAPEQARGDLELVGAATDVYAVGALLYELVTGHAPYAADGASAEEIVERVRTEPPPPLPRDLTAALQAIIERAMARRPSDRYASMQALGDDLRAFLEARVVSAHRTGALAELGMWVRRNRGLALTMALLLVTLVVGLATTGSLFVEARERSDDVLRLSSLRDVERLRAEADALWPAHPERLEDLDAWARRARALIDELPMHRASLAALRARAGVDAEEPAYTAESGRDAWWDEELRRLITELEDLDANLMGEAFAGGAGWSIPRRVAAATALRERRAGDTEAWRAAAELARERYGGLELSPQVGLVPLGADPESGLLEFWHVASGDRPERDAEGRLKPTESTGIVLVLVPGGEGLMGAQASDPAADRFDPRASPFEQPVHPVRLDPFFLAKHELTQAQWLAVNVENPSTYLPGRRTMAGTITADYPVVTVTWHDARRTLTRFGLELPTQAQWERACRAETDTPFFTGREAATLQGFANIADAGSAKVWQPGWAHEPDLDDGFDVIGRVGSFRANPYGFHDMHGNVWEWCLDSPTRFDLREARDGDGLGEPVADSGRVACRGGSYYLPAVSARVTTINITDPASSSDDVGIRAARRLDP